MAAEFATPAPTTDPAKDPVGTVRHHPDWPANDRRTPRLWKVETTHPDDWPWRRLTGLAPDVPSQDTDISTWPVQPLGDVGIVFGHRIILTGREVTAG